MSRSQEYMLSGEMLLYYESDEIECDDYTIVGEIEDLNDTVYVDEVLWSIQECDEYKNMEKGTAYHVYFTGHVVFETTYNYEYGEEHDYYVELEKIVFRKLP